MMPQACAPSSSSTTTARGDPTSALKILAFHHHEQKEDEEGDLYGAQMFEGSSQVGGNLQLLGTAVAFL